MTSVALAGVTAADTAAELAADPVLTHYDRLRSLMATVFSEGHGGTKAEVKDLLVPDHMAKASFYTVWNRAYEMHVITRISGTQKLRLHRTASRCRVRSAQWRRRLLCRRPLRREPNSGFRSSFRSL